jgi:putative transposase
MAKSGVSERLACRVLGQHRSTQRKIPQGRSDEMALTADIITLAAQDGRYGYRRIAAMLWAAGPRPAPAGRHGMDG